MTMKKIILALCLFCCLPAASDAQGCSVCSKTASGRGDKAANGLNVGIIYLAFLPLGIMGTLGYIWWKHNKV
jgi:hypothetical protein